MTIRSTYRGRLPLLAAVLVGGLPGCASRSWTASQPVEIVCSDAERSYAEGWRLEEACQATCVDAYLHAAVAAWPAVECGSGDPRSCELYHAAACRLIATAQQFGRWKSESGLSVAATGGSPPVETVYRGFLWEPEEFGSLEVVTDDSAPNISRPIRSPGIGVPVVVSRSGRAVERPFVADDQPFAATAVIRSCDSPQGAVWRLELYDPLRESCVAVTGRQAPLASDLTAPLAQRDNAEKRIWLDDFLRPAGSGEDDALVMMEPYQPGKIPVLLVHGLLSDPATWANLINELQAEPELLRRFQIWSYRYDTGEPFFASAAVLRRQLAEIRACYDPQHEDPAFDDMVLVGHSMGGLVSKLQVTYSGEKLWNAAASRPLEAICTDGATRAALAASFFFDAQPDITRVVYIGTPHRGSGLARRSVGRVSSALVEPSELARSRHEQLTCDNPGAFSEELSRRLPTSIDLLEPDSPLLMATMRLPYRRGVTLHSIIGEGSSSLRSGPSDGVVPVSSAYLEGVASDRFVDARHSEETRNEEVIAEVKRILALHARRAGF